MKEMSLKDELSGIIGNKKRFVLMRVADIDTSTALKLCHIPHGTYNSWCREEKFTEIYRRVDEFAGNYRQEAIQLLRRDNQLAAVLLEGKIIEKLKEELDTGEYTLLKTHLAREVYGKLINALDVIIQRPVESWGDRLQRILTSSAPEQLGEGNYENNQGGYIDGQFEAVGIETAELAESPSESESK